MPAATSKTSSRPVARVKSPPSAKLSAPSSSVTAPNGVVVPLPPITSPKAPTTQPPSNTTTSGKRATTTATSSKPLPPLDPKPSTAPRGGTRPAAPPAARTSRTRSVSSGPSKPNAKLSAKEIRRAEEARRAAAALKIQQWYRRRRDRLDWRQIVNAAREYARVEEQRQQERIQKAKRVLRRFLHYASWRIRIVKRERLFQRQLAASAKVLRCLWGRASETLMQRLRFERLSHAALVIMRRWKESAMFAKVRWRKANDTMRELLETESYVERRDIERRERQEWMSSVIVAWRKSPAVTRYHDAMALERLEDAAVFADRERKMVLRSNDGGGAGAKNRLSRGLSRMHRTGSSPTGAFGRSEEDDAGSVRWTRRLGDRLQAANRSNSIASKSPRRAPSTASGTGGDGLTAPRIRFNDSTSRASDVVGSPETMQSVSRPSTRGDPNNVSVTRLDISHMDLLELHDDHNTAIGITTSLGDDLDDGNAPHSPLAVATAGAVDPFSLDWLMNAPLPPRSSVVSESSVHSKQAASMQSLGGWYPWIRSTDYNRLAAGLQIADDATELVGRTHVARLINDHAVERLLLQEHTRRQTLSGQYFSLTQGLYNEQQERVRLAAMEALRLTSAST